MTAGAQDRMSDPRMTIVRDELVAIGLDTSKITPDELDRVCVEIADIAARHGVPLREAARTFAYTRAVLSPAARKLRQDG